MPHLLRRGAQAVITILAVAACAVFATAHAIPTLLGWVPLAVYTGSMEPTYRPGDAIVVDVITTREEGEALRTGDIVTFMPHPDNPQLVTHRITGLSTNQAGEKVFHTQGDANSSPDAFEHPITHEQVRATPLYSIPLYGYVLTAIPHEARENARLAALAGVGAYILRQVIALVRELVRDRRGRRGLIDADPTAVPGAYA